MPRPDIHDLIDERVKKKVKKPNTTGTIRSARNGWALVKIAGTSTFTPAACDPSIPSEQLVDKKCSLIWDEEDGVYAVAGVYSSIRSGLPSGGRPATNYELAPPGSFSAHGGIIPNAVLFRWAAPPQQAVAFEVQTNTTDSEVGASSELVTRGSYYIHEATTTVYARVRSISDKFEYSNWTEWVSAAPSYTGGIAVFDMTTSDTYTGVTGVHVSGVNITDLGGRRLEWLVTSGGFGSGGMVSVGAYADPRPLASAGSLYIPTDGLWNQEVYFGGEWRPMHDGALLTVPPSGGWTDLGTVTKDVSLGARYIHATGASGGDHRGEYRNAPSTPYTITARLEIAPMMTNLNTAGLFFRESGSGKLATFEFVISNLTGGTAVLYAQVGKWTNPTTFSANYTTVTIGVHPKWLRIADDGANRICSLSADGKNWIQIHSVGRTDFLTADQVGWFIDSRSGSVEQAATLLSWEIS